MGLGFWDSSLGEQIPVYPGPASTWLTDFMGLFKSAGPCLVPVGARALPTSVHGKGLEQLPVYSLNTQHSQELPWLPELTASVSPSSSPCGDASSAVWVNVLHLLLSQPHEE